MLDQLYYGNKIESWAIALGLMVLSLVAAKLFYYLSSKILHKLSKKSEGKIDDILVDKLEEPIVGVIITTGIYFSIKFLNLSAGVEKFVDQGFRLAVTFGVAWAISRVFDSIVTEYLRPAVEKSESDLDDQLLPIASKSLKVGIWILAIVVGLNNAGYDVGALIAGLGIGGLAFALAAQDTVANLFGGVMIFVDRPFSVNERIKIDGFDGHIREIGLRSTRLQTLEGRYVSIPNRKFTDNAIENVSSEPERKVVMQLGLTYDADANDMRRALEILKKLASDQEQVSEKVMAWFTEFGDSALIIKFIYYIRPGADNLEVQNIMNLNILDRFNAENLDFAFPTQTLHIAGKANAMEKAA